MTGEKTDKAVHNYSVINDAVHGVMSFPKEYTNLIKFIMDSEVFQRLRHIKQLGMAELIFPTAVHNRFCHSLGTAYIAYRISDKLGLKEKDKQYATVGALLHDIGHGPFSHAFESFLVNKRKQKIKHEKWTQNFLQEFEKVLLEYDLDYKKVSRLIEKKDREDKDDSNYYLTRDIITSQVDADRLDYLLRDSHFCGVPYGNPDINWIIQHVTQIDETAQPPRLGFLKKGWHAVEHFLLCRRIMTQNIAYHNKINFFEGMFIFFLNEITKDTRLISKISNYKLREFMKNSGKYKDSSDCSPNQFIKDNYEYYKTLTDYDLWMLIRDFSLNEYGEASEIAKKIYTRKPHKTFQFNSTCEGAVSSILLEWREKKEVPEWKAFIIEGDTMSYDAQDDPVLIKEGDDTLTVHRIQHYSFLLKVLGDKSEKLRYLAIEESVPEEELIEKLRKYISFPSKP